MVKGNLVGSIPVPFIEHKIKATCSLDQGDKKYDDIEIANLVNNKGDRGTLWENPISRGIPVTISPSDKSKMTPGIDGESVYCVKRADTAGEVIFGICESTPKPVSGDRDEANNIIVKGTIERYFVKPGQAITSSQRVGLNSDGSIEPSNDGKMFSMVNVDATSTNLYIDVFEPYEESVVI